MKQMTVPEEMKIDINFDNEKLPKSVKVLRPLVFEDGDNFCCVLGPDSQEGVFGCGRTAEEALKDWDDHVNERIKHPIPGDEVTKFIMDHLKN